MRSKLLFASAGLLALTLTACLGDDAGPIAVTDAWARTSPASAENGAAYMTITSDVDDTLIGASADSSIAAAIEVHETVMAEHTDDSMSDDSMSDEGMTDDTMAGMGAMSMQEVESIALPAGEPVSLEPGGYHIMLLGLAEPLEAGSTFDVTLRFGSGDEVVVTVEVRDEAP